MVHFLEQLKKNFYQALLLSQKIFKDNGEYNIDHSSPVILLKNGNYVARISHRDDIKKSIQIIKKYL